MLTLQLARVKACTLSNAEDSDGMNYAVAELKILCDADEEFLHSIGAPKTIMKGRSKVKSAKIEKPAEAMELKFHSFRHVQPGGDIPENPVAKKDFDLNIPTASIREWSAARSNGRITITVTAFVRHHVELIAEWFTSGQGHAWTGEIRMVKAQKEIDDPNADVEEEENTEEAPKNARNVKESEKPQPQAVN